MTVCIDGTQFMASDRPDGSVRLMFFDLSDHSLECVAPVAAEACCGRRQLLADLTYVDGFQMPVEVSISL